MYIVFCSFLDLVYYFSRTQESNTAIVLFGGKLPKTNTSRRLQSFDTADFYVYFLFGSNIVQ